MAAPRELPPPAPRAVGSQYRAALLDAAAALYCERGFGPTRMQDVADAVGVSRQTVYNEFGTKRRLARELVRWHGARYLDGLDEALRCHRDVAAIVAGAAGYTLATTAGDPFAKLIFTGAGREDLRPLLAGQIEAVHSATRDRVAEHLLRVRPGLDRDEATCLADVVVRLIWSHVVLPIGPACPDQGAVPAHVARVAARYLGEPRQAISYRSPVACERHANSLRGRC